MHACMRMIWIDRHQKGNEATRENLLFLKNQLVLQLHVELV